MRDIIGHEDWRWMEFRIPVQMPGEKETRWPVIQYDRTKIGDAIATCIRVSDCPLRVTIEPWSEEGRVTRFSTHPVTVQPSQSKYPHYSRFTFDSGQSTVHIKLHLAETQN